MPLPRFHKLPEEKRERILNAAGEAFARDGFEGASLNRILEEAEISKGAAYYYFADKEDLFATVIRHALEHVVSDNAPELDELTADNYWPRIESFYAAAFAHVHEHTWMVKVAHPPTGALSPSTLPEGPVREVFEELLGWLGGLLNRGRDLGVVRDDLPEEVLVGLFVAVDGVLDRWAMENWRRLSQPERERMTTTFVSLMKEMLMARVPAQTRVAE